MRIEAIPVSQIDIQPSVIVVVEESQPASLGFNDEPFVIDAAPYIGDGQPGLLRYIDKLDWRVSRLLYSGFQNNGILPFPEWRRKCVDERAAEHQKR
jgi:hypothetical protein